jgi:hypothetical protein
VDFGAGDASSAFAVLKFVESESFKVVWSGEDDPRHPPLATSGSNRNLLPINYLLLRFRYVDEEGTLSEFSLGFFSYGVFW